MWSQVRLAVSTWSAVRTHLLGSEAERMAYLLARAGRWESVDGQPVLDLLVVAGVLVPDAALLTQSRVRVEVAPEFTKAILVECFEAGLSLVDIHTHPFADTEVTFSGHDRENMRCTHSDFLDRMPDDPPVGVASLVLGRRSVAGTCTDPASRVARPLDRIVVLGQCQQEVELCR